jgi:hypothetical protein
MLFRKIETVEKLVGPYVLVSIPYGDVILLKEELGQIWSLLPSKTFTVDQVASCIKKIGIGFNRNDTKLVLEILLQIGLVIEE